MVVSTLPVKRKLQVEIHYGDLCNLNVAGNIRYHLKTLITYDVYKSREIGCIQFQDIVGRTQTKKIDDMVNRIHERHVKALQMKKLRHIPAGIYDENGE